jgi:hypothetical protein
MKTLSNYKTGRNVFVFILFALLFGLTPNEIQAEGIEEPCQDCLTSPLLFCPPSYFGCPDDSLDPAMTGTPVALPGDINCPEPEVSYTDTLITDTPCFKKYHRIWTAQYPPDSASTKLIAQCIQTLILEDDSAPVISACPSDILIDLVASCDSTAIWTLPTAEDNCGFVNLSSNFEPGDSFPSGSTQVLYIAEDFCGQRDSCSFNILVMGVCCENLELSCPPDTTACVNSSLDPSETGMAVVSMPDSSCVNPLIFFSDSILGSNPECSNGSIVQRTWFASDSSQTNIYTSCTQIITTQDTVAPTITNLPQDITLTGLGFDCAAELTWNEPDVDDDCGVFAFSSNIPNGSQFEEGVSIISYAAVDFCGNTATASFSITVECDTSCFTAPLIDCPADYIACPQDSIPLPGQSGMATATPGDSLCLAPVISYTDSIISSGPCSGAMIVERSWIAQDPDKPELADSCVQIITLEDNIAPSISNMPPDITIEGDGQNCLVPVSWIEPTAEDNCGIASFEPNIPVGSLLSEGITTVVYTAIDNCGLISTVSFTITVICANACTDLPTLTCPPDYWACPTGSIPDPSVSGYPDVYPGSADCEAPLVSYNDIIIASGPCPLSKVVERHWTATDPDDSSLSVSCIQLLSLDDFQPPSILYCPSDITVQANNYQCETNVSWNAPLAIDNCGAPDLSAKDSYGNIINNGQVFNQGTTTVIYTSTDLCGNMSQCSFDVTVVCGSSCNTPPTIYCPSNKTVCPGSNTSAQSLGFAQAYPGSGCSSGISIHFQDMITAIGNCYGEKTIQRTWTASYNNNSSLSSSCVQTIQLKDNTAPVFSYCPQDITVYSSQTAVSWTLPQATDNCSSVQMSTSHNPGSYFPVGTSEVRYTASDNCWNTSVCSFHVTVQQQYNIPLDCPNDIHLSCNANGGAFADWNAPAYNGSCDPCNSSNYIPGFIYMGSLNGSQYYCSTSTASWLDAKNNCASNGGYLVSINSHEENQYLASILTLQSAWIGLSDHLNEGHFKWTNGDNLSYTNWAAGQPNNYYNNQDYVEMLSDGKWNDQYNHYKLEYIMEIPCSQVVQTEGPAPGSFLSAGNYRVSYEVQDACGGFGSCSFDIFVSGGLEVSCPDDIVSSAPANSNGVVVSWNEPTASTCCGQCSDQNAQQLQGFYYLGTFQGNKYYQSLSSQSWPYAKQNSESNGGYLAVIQSQQENDFLKNRITASAVWIGLSDHQNEGQFEWVTGEALNYTNWYPGQPNNYSNNQDYVEMLSDGRWNDQYNHYALPYILEIPSCIDIVQVSGPQNGTLLPPGSTHTVSYRITDACGNYETCSFNIEVQSVPIQQNYCSSQGLNSIDYYITNVEFGQLSNRSGDDNGYGDYTNVCGTIEKNSSYTISLTPSVNQQDRIYWRVWIDYNGDGDFYDQDEMVAYGSGISTVTGIITTPSDILEGETRMRIIASPMAYPQDPCVDYPLGETEDYCLTTLSTSNIHSNTNIVNRNTGPAELLESEVAMPVLSASIYPNPVSDRLFINLENESVVSNIYLQDVNGRIIGNWKASDIRSDIEFDVSALASGIYFVRLESIYHNSKYYKVIITH